jgi:hypothetical protein
MPRKPGNPPPATPQPDAPPKAPDARTHFFESSAFAAVRAEDVDAVANLKANLVALYQPVNSEELFAIERIALARHSLLRTYRIEAGFITLGLEEALEIPNNPGILKNPDLTNGLKVTQGQNHGYWMAAGFCQLNRKSDWQIFLRYQAQAERLYRRAIEDFERIRAFRGTLPEQNLPEQNLPEQNLPEQNLRQPDVAKPEPKSAEPHTPQPVAPDAQPETQHPAAAVPNRARHIPRHRRPARANHAPRPARRIPDSRQSAEFGHPNAP